jgi:hypothetical protein
MNDLYRQKGTTLVFRLRAISIDGAAIASLAGINVKMVVKVPHKRLAVDYEPVRVGEPDSPWVNTETGALVEFKKANGRGVHIVGPKRGKMVPRVLDYGEWGARYVPLDEWNP